MKEQKKNQNNYLYCVYKGNIYIRVVNLRFWPLKEKKLKHRPLSFATVAVLTLTTTKKDLDNAFFWL